MLIIGFANLGIGVVTTILLANLMPASEYGSYVFAFGLANIAAMPIELGLPTLMMREIARSRARDADRKIIAIIVWVLAFLAGSLLIMLSAMLLYWQIGPPMKNLGPALTLWTVALLLPLALMNWARGILLGFAQSVAFALPDSIFRPALLLIFVGVLAIFGDVDAATAMACHVAAVALCFAWSAQRAFATLRTNLASLSFSRADWETRVWIGSLIPITLISGVRIVSRRIDIVMIGFLGTTIAVASYNIALQLVSVILVAQTVLNSVIGPRLAFAHERDDIDGMRTSLAQATIVSVAFAAASVLGIVVAGPFVIPLLFANGYGDIYMVALILCIGQMFSAAMGPTALLLNMSRNEKKTLQTGVIAMLVSVATNAVLIPPFHAVGAAIASSLTLVVIQTQRWWMAWRHIGVRADIFAAIAQMPRMFP